MLLVSDVSVVWETMANLTSRFSTQWTNWTCAWIVFASGTQPPGELQVPPPPDPEPAGQAVPNAGLQAGLFGQPRPRRSASTHPWPAAGHHAGHEEWTHGLCQWQQQPQQPCYPSQYGQSRQWGEWTLGKRKRLNVNYNIVNIWNWNWGNSMTSDDWKRVKLQPAI